MYTVQARSLPRRKKASQRGLAVIWVTFSIIAIMGVSALAIDVSYFYERKAEAQKAADAAALAGVYSLSYGNSNSVADAAADTYSASNGYTAAQTTITHDYKVAGNYHVVVSRPEPVFFGAISMNARTKNISASATAAYDNFLPTQIDPTWYGRIDGPTNYALYGPDNGATRGDAITPKYLAIDGSMAGVTSSTANPYHDTVGYNYYISVPSNYATVAGTSSMNVEIYDPDIYWSGTNPPFSQPDENHGATSAEKWRFSLYYNKSGNIYDESQDQLITSKVYGEGDADEANTDMRWVCPAGWSINTASYPVGSFRINVKPDNGSGGYGSGMDEQGFNLRAGPPETRNTSNYIDLRQSVARPDLSNPAHNETARTINGHSVPIENDNWWWAELYGPQHPDTTTSGVMTNLGFPVINNIQMGQITYTSINFNQSGTTTILLGNVAASLAGQTLTINSFDCDNGATDVWYSCSAYANSHFQGVLSTNGKWSYQVGNGAARGVSTSDQAIASNIVTLPANYPGGSWTVHYVSGVSDNTTWEWQVTGMQTQATHHIHLVASGSGTLD